VPRALLEQLSSHGGEVREDSLIRFLDRLRNRVLHERVCVGEAHAAIQPAFRSARNASTWQRWTQVVTNDQ
jgi:hypothetical protein